MWRRRAARHHRTIARVREGERLASHPCNRHARCLKLAARCRKQVQACKESGDLGQANWWRRNAVNNIKAAREWRRRAKYHRGNYG